MVIGIIILYMLVVLGIGVWSMRQTKSSSDFFIAGKQLGLIAVALASFSAAISGFVFVGGPGIAYSLGMGTLWLTFPTSISFAMAWLILGKRMRLLADTHDAMTVPDALHARFDDGKVSGLAAVATIIGLVLYLATQISAFAFILGPIFGIGFYTAVIIGMAIVLVYSAMGGMIAGVYTDVFQGSIMAIASLAVFIFTLKAGGGMSNITTTLAQEVGPDFVGPWGLVPATLAMGWFFCLAIGIVGQPQLLHKFYMFKDIKKMKWGPLMAAIPAMLTGLLWMGVGLVVRYLAVTGKLPEPAMELMNKSADNAIAVFLNNYTPKFLAGIIFAGIASAVMSTADSFINIASAAAVRDIPKAFGKKVSSEQELKWGRIAVVVLSILTVIISFTFGTKGIAILGAFGWGTFAAALAPALGIGLNWKRATKTAAFWSILIGLGLNVILEIGSKMGMAFYVNIFKPLGIYNGTFSMVVSTILFILISYATSPREISQDLESVMDA